MPGRQPSHPTLASARESESSGPSISSLFPPLVPFFSLSYRILINTKYCSERCVDFFSNIAIEHFYGIDDFCCKSMSDSRDINYKNNRANNLLARLPCCIRWSNAVTQRSILSRSQVAGGSGELNAFSPFQPRDYDLVPTLSEPLSISSGQAGRPADTVYWLIWCAFPFRFIALSKKAISHAIFQKISHILFHVYNCTMRSNFLYDIN